MKLSDGSQLTYCTNIHPGESWDEIESNLHQYLPEIKRLVSPNEQFGVGLRLSAVAAETLGNTDRLTQFKTWLEQEGLYVFTINGFPYGTFHGRPVKAGVYQPDWRFSERLSYTSRLATILAALLPEGMKGSISTVPGAYKEHLTHDDDVVLIASNLLTIAVELHHLNRRTGRCIALALEPEPGCQLETTTETVDFFLKYLFSPAAVAKVMHLSGLDHNEAKALLRCHLGLCLDTCHAAVAFEDPNSILASLSEADIPIHKLQLSAGLRIPNPGATERMALSEFNEDTYLHQTRARIEKSVYAYADLTDALVDATIADEWRIHYHVPLWAERLEIFSTTADWLEELLCRHRQQIISAHLEVETYTWSVLPLQHRSLPITEAIAQELNWVLHRIT